MQNSTVDVNYKNLLNLHYTCIKSSLYVYNILLTDLQNVTRNKWYFNQDVVVF